VQVVQQPALPTARDRAAAGAERPQLLKRDDRIRSCRSLADPPIKVIQPYLDVLVGDAYRSISVCVIQPYLDVLVGYVHRSITRSSHA
jgi:hypothetical protein